jgi:hypothetical protein
MRSAVRQPRIFLGSGFSTTSKMSLSYLLQFLVVCMIISATKPETAEWMDEFTNDLIIILQNMLMNGTLNIFKIRGLTLKGVLKDLREGVRKHKISGKPFGICVFLGGQKPSFTLNDNFFVFFKELVDQVLKNPKQPQDEVKKEPQVELPKLDPQVEISKLDPQVVPQVEPNQCWCEGFSSSCVCARRSCYCARCVESPCDKFLPAIKFMRNMSYNFLRQISCISFFLHLRFSGRLWLQSPSDLNTAIVLRNLTHANEFQLNSSTRRKLLHMSLAIKLTKLLFGRFTYSSAGGRKWINRMEKRLNSRCFLKSLQKGYCVQKEIPWHNGIRGMNMYSFNYVFCNPAYYSFLVSVALNPNPFRWIFDNWKQFARISMSIEEEVQSIRWYSSHRRQSYSIYCQSNVVEQRIISYRNAILYGNYGSFPDFLKGLVRDLDLKDPPQDDFNLCILFATS